MQEITLDSPAIPVLPTLPFLQLLTLTVPAPSQRGNTIAAPQPRMAV